MKISASLNGLSPGPGSYDPSTSFEGKGAVTMKSSRFLSPTNLSPGPGCYLERSPKVEGVKFTMSCRKELFQSCDSPGPGQYEVKGTNTGRKFKMLGKKKEMVNNNPGPGRYSPKFIVKKFGTKTIGNSKRRELVVVLDTPGPGQYENKAQAKAPSWTFGSKNTSFTNSTPGPGKYNSVDLNRSIGGASNTSIRPELFPTTASPGPGSYESSPGRFASLRYSVPKSKRPKIGTDAPGPGRYEPKSLTHSFSAKFGNECKKTLIFGNDVPAASTYSPRVQNKAPSFSFSKKLEQKPGNRNPGPGKYSSGKDPKAVNGKISTSLRFIKSFAEKQLEGVPGPGAYECKSELASKKVFISKSKREFKPSSVPGPGKYNI